MNRLEFEMNFKVLRNEAGEVNGFSLIAKPHSLSELFCRTFPKALVDGKASITFEGEEILFNHPNGDFQVRCEHKLDSAGSASLQELVGGKRQLKIDKAGSLTPGFKIVPA